MRGIGRCGGFHGRGDLLVERTACSNLQLNELARFPVTSIIQMGVFYHLELCMSAIEKIKLRDLVFS